MKHNALWLSRLFISGLFISLIAVGCDDDDDDDTVQEVVYDLSGPANAANEKQTNPVVSSATGNITGTYNQSTNVLQYTITWTGLTGNATAMHFHGPASPQESAGVLIPIPGANTPSGTISKSETLTDEVEAHLLGGKVYYNIHTGTYGQGEIRGNIVTTRR
jgi:hypothetical protein